MKKLNERKNKDAGILNIDIWTMKSGKITEVKVGKKIFLLGHKPNKDIKAIQTEKNVNLSTATQYFMIKYVDLAGISTETINNTPKDYSPLLYV